MSNDSELVVSDWAELDVPLRQDIRQKMDINDRLTYALLGKERWLAYINAIRLGVTRSLAANSIGVLSSVVNGWIERGESTLAMMEKCAEQGLDVTEYIDPASLPYAIFASHVMEAEGEAVSRWVSLINEAAANDWRASAWLLERVHSDDYKQRTSSEQRTDVSQDITFTADLLHQAKTKAENFELEMISDGDDSNDS